MQPFVLPPPLRPGDCIRIIAPAGAVGREAFAAGLALIEAAGFVPVYDAALLEPYRYFAGEQGRRQAELLAALAEPGTRAIWAARGGYGTAQLLEPLHAGLLHTHRKWLVGFSDLTALHAVYQQAQMLSVHGANVTTLASWSDAARRSLFALLGAQRVQQSDPSNTAAWTSSFVGEQTGGTKAAPPMVTGRLWGGNLTVLASLCGTGQLPKPDSAEPTILLLEDIGEAPYRLDRCWQQLQASGAVQHVVGVAIGQLTHCEAKAASYTGLEILTSAIERTGLPWMSGLPFGHAADAQAVALGAIAHLDLKKRQLVVAL
jgi:muramoyltetrapeptide carboxypeptidase